jgi:hypothetical protein
VSFVLFKRRRDDGRAVNATLMLTPTRAKDAVADVIQPWIEHMEAVRPGRWALPGDREIRPVFAISEYKGGALGLTYGLSLAWVPHFEGNQCRWHRTVRQSRQDLRVEQRALDGAMSAVTMSLLDGEEHLREHARIAIERVGPQAIEWWQTTSDPSSVLAEALRQAQVPNTHNPRPSYVAAFTHARLGHLESAKSLLEREAIPGDKLARALSRLDEVVPTG